MVGILRSFDSGLTPGLTQVPQGSLAIDWSHPLANGLLYYFLPGVADHDVAGLVPGNFNSTSATRLFGLSPEGPAADSTIASSSNGLGTQSSVPGLSSAVSIYCRGYKAGVTPSNTAVIGGLTFSVPNVSPFKMAWLIYGGSSTSIKVEWNQGGITNFLIFTNSWPTTGLFSLGATLIHGGAVTTYFNGLQDNTFSPITLTASAAGVFFCSDGNILMTLHCAWNRVLSADEMMRIHLDPYGMLVPAEYEMPVMAPPPPPLISPFGFTWSEY